MEILRQKDFHPDHRVRILMKRKALKKIRKKLTEKILGVYQAVIWNISKPFLYVFPRKVSGIKIYLNPSDNVISRKCFLRKKWEPLEVKKITESIRENSICIDVGANIGIYTCLMSKFVGPNGRVISFEPDIVNFKYLEKNSRDKSNVTINNMAITEKTGEIELFTSKDHLGDHRIYNPKNDARRSVAKIKSTSLTDYLEQENIPLEKISVIKMDTQGAEPMIMTSMASITRELVNAVLFIEFWPQGYEDQSINIDEYLSFLNENFVVHDLNYIQNTLTEIPTIKELKRIYVDYRDQTKRGINHTTLMLKAK